jgi:hypothetical protein
VNRLSNLENRIIEDKNRTSKFCEVFLITKITLVYLICKLLTFTDFTVHKKEIFSILAYYRGARRHKLDKNNRTSWNKERDPDV